MDTPMNDELGQFSEQELAQATGQPIARVRSWLNGAAPPPIGLKLAIDTMRSYSSAESANAPLPKSMKSAPSGTQQSLFDGVSTENDAFLKRQLITYIGNKRSLLPFIETGIREAKAQLRADRIDFLDLFSGSGVVARMARQHSRLIHCNDLELYSYVANSCYQSSVDRIPADALNRELLRIRNAVRESLAPGFITELYSPQDDDNIRPGERVFYTRRNAVFLDTFCNAIQDSPSELRPFLLGPILSQSSMHANTSGVLK
jgi:adenine-specific DNA-methyltransferase